MVKLFNILKVNVEETRRRNLNYYYICYFINYVVAGTIFR